MWTLDPIDAPKYANFQSQFDAEVLATWDWKRLLVNLGQVSICPGAISLGHVPPAIVSDDLWDSTNKKI